MVMSSRQRAQVGQFMGIVSGCKESTAAKYLKSHDWNFERALDAFFQSETPNDTVAVAQHAEAIGRLFNQYRDQPRAQPDQIGIDGAQKYLNDVGVGLEEVSHVALCELLQSTSIGEFTRDKFIHGWQTLEKTKTTPAYDTIAAQASHVVSMRRRIQRDRTYFKQVYRYAFNLARPDGQKSVPADAAVDFWRMFYSIDAGGIDWNGDSTPWLDWWLEYYETKYKRPVNKDLWYMMEELVNQTREPNGETLAWWSEDGSWPTAVDEFVAFVKEKRGDTTMVDSQTETIE